jgi:ABC-type amino acid transport substrate-binding protein
MGAVRSFLILVAVLSLHSLGKLSAAEATLHFCFNNYPPFETQIGDRPSGISIEIYREAARRADLAVEFDELPWQRCLNYVANHQRDGALDGATRPGLLSSQIVVVTDETALVLLEDSPIKDFGALEQWDGRRISVTLNWVLLGEIGRDKRIIFEALADERTQLEALRAHRQQAALMSPYQAISLSRQMGIKIRLFLLADTQVNLSLLFNPELAAVATRFDRALRDIDEDGTARKILLRYVHGNLPEGRVLPISRAMVAE